MNLPNILILSASVGNGHRRAAEAVELALAERCPNAKITHADVLELAHPLFRRVYSRGYFGAIKRAPHLVGYLYDRLDQPLRRWERPVDRIRCRLQGLNLRHVTDLLVSEEWDLAICTHFLPAEVISQLRIAGRIEFPQIIVTTDFDTHRLWHNDPCEHYFTATEEGRRNLAAYGVPASRITVSGIPIHPAFARLADIWECRRQLGLLDDRTVVLQLAGGLGIGPIERLHRELLNTQTPLSIITVTGRNSAVRAKIEDVRCPERHHRKILGFTNQMDKLMGVADLIVSKPGGLTTSEALACGVPMIIVDPIPGQETRNSDFLLENGAAIKVNNLASLGHKISSVLGEPGRLNAMQAAARKLGRPNAAMEIAGHCLRLLDVPKPLSHFAIPRRRAGLGRTRALARAH